MLNLAEFDNSAQFKIKNSDFSNIFRFSFSMEVEVKFELILLLAYFVSERNSSLKKLFPAQAGISAFKLTF